MSPITFSSLYFPNTDTDRYDFIISIDYDNNDRRGAGAQGCDCTVVDSIPTRGNELLFINIFISSLWRQGKSPALNFTKQYARKNRLKVGNGVY